MHPRRPCSSGRRTKAATRPTRQAAGWPVAAGGSPRWGADRLMQSYPSDGAGLICGSPGERESEAMAEMVKRRLPGPNFVRAVMLLAALVAAILPRAALAQQS